MPRAATRKLVDDQVYECWASFAADGLPGVIARGTRLRAPTMWSRAHPHWFVTAGTPQHEWPSQLGTDKPPVPAPEPKCDIRLQVEPRPLASVVEAARPITVLIDSGAVNLAGGLPGRLLVFEKGARFKADAELAMRMPDAFREV